MDNEIFEVSRDEYAGFLRQINVKTLDTEINHADDLTVIKVYSKTSGKHLCSRIVTEDGPEYYYIFNMPPDEDRTARKKVAKITLNTQEEVQAFFDVLNKLSKGEKK